MWTECVCVCVTMSVCAFQKLTDTPLLCLKSFFFRSYLSWSQGSVKSKPCRLSRALSRSPRLPQHFKSPSTDVELDGLFFSLSLSVPVLCFISSQHAARKSCVPNWTIRTLKSRQLGERRGGARGGDAVSSSASLRRTDGRTDGRMACANCCLLFRRSSAFKAAKKLSRTHVVHRTLCASDVRLGFSSVNRIITFYTPRFVPHCRCLGCFDAFYLEMTINFTLLFSFFRNINIYMQVNVTFLCLCSSIWLLLFCEYSR